MKIASRLCWTVLVVLTTTHNAPAALVGYWPFNGTADEETGANCDLTLFGDAGFGASVHSGLGPALSLDGTGDGAIGQNFVKFAGDDCTVVAWAYAESMDGEWNTIVKNWGTTAGGQFHLGLGDQATNRLQNYRASGAFVQDPNDFPEGQWVHTAFVLDSTLGEHRLYLNGAVVATGPYLEPNGQGNAVITGLGVGHKPNNDGTDLSNNGGGPWNGRIDDVGMFDEALTTEQILQIYQNGLVGIQLDGTTEPPQNQPGDFDSDGDVDGADFVAWQTNFPTATGATLDEGDADGDGDVDGADFVVWQTNFPFTPAPGAAPVPEPAAWILALAALAWNLKLAYGRTSRKRFP